MKQQRLIVITGFMGCGKTAVARGLGRRLSLTTADLDEMITQREGRSPAQIIVEEGEAAFRMIETDTLRDLLKSGTAQVIALGGGAWIQEANRDLIHQYSCLSVWLDAPFETCWTRIKASGDERPFGKTRDEASALYQQRRPIYQLANIHIRLGDENLANVVSRIAAELNAG